MSPRYDVYHTQPFSLLVIHRTLTLLPQQIRLVLFTDKGAAPRDQSSSRARILRHERIWARKGNNSLMWSQNFSMPLYY